MMRNLAQSQKSYMFKVRVAGLRKIIVTMVEIINVLFCLSASKLCESEIRDWCTLVCRCFN